MNRKRTRKTIQTVWNLKNIANFAISILPIGKPDKEVTKEL